MRSLLTVVLELIASHEEGITNAKLYRELIFSKDYLVYGTRADTIEEVMRLLLVAECVRVVKDDNRNIVIHATKIGKEELEKMRAK